jgi:hypothetical protein
MKSAWFSSILLTAVLSLAIFSCEKNDNDDNISRNGTGAGKGSGGNITLRVIPVHDSVYVDSCMVYVKYNSETNPTILSGYDDSVKCKIENGKPVATFYELRKGTYLFYAYGWDIIRSQTVVGSRVYYATTERTTTDLELQTHAKP